MATDWFCKIGQKEFGPFKDQDLQRLAANKKLQPEHQVRRGTQGPWVPAGRVKGLFPASHGGGKPAGTQPGPAKPAAMPTAKPIILPTAEGVSAPAPPADLPEGLSLGGGHGHHAQMNFDQFQISAEPVHVAGRKGGGTGMKKAEQQKVTMILLGGIGGALLLCFAIIMIWLVTRPAPQAKAPVAKKSEAAAAREKEKTAKATEKAPSDSGKAASGKAKKATDKSDAPAKGQKAKAAGAGDDSGNDGEKAATAKKTAKSSETPAKSDDGDSDADGPSKIPPVLPVPKE